SEGSLRTTDVSRSFDGVQALQGVSLQIERHEVVGLIGPNGAGKTTLINLITGFDLPSSGKIELGDEDVTRWRAVRRARAGLARTFQHGHLFGSLSVAENIQLAALGVGMSPRGARQVCEELLGALELRGHAHLSAAALAHGDEQKVGVARALASRPRYVLLDEPAAGLSEADIDSFCSLVRRVRDDFEAGVLLVDHNMAVIMDVCDRIYVLDQGRTLAEGPPAEIRRNIDVTAAYLGSSGVEDAARA
ncbi:MAG: ATP-binding cassette domain-containing protein, partial [Actinomycetota bacterium]|nr:ATP-binding cassette domain-containing protein [Actinomycetota bacterium]